MTGLEADIERLRSKNTGLTQESERLWTLAGLAKVSYPENSHSVLASIEPRSYWFNHRNEVILRVVRRFPPGGRIYDVGGGSGYVSLRLREAGFETLVIEPGPQGARAAHDRGLPVVRAAFQDLQIEDASVPALGLFDVLEHIENDLEALRNLWRILPLGGRLYLTVPAHGALWSKEDDVAGHYRRYGAGSVSRVLRQAGFEVEFVSYFFSILVAPIFLFRALPSRLGVRRANQASETANEHSLPSNAIGVMFRKSFDRELRVFDAGGRIGFGASCVVSARKA